ncbi:hypothetical protein [Catenovulum agarivorans]|uniref:hypothetical protein n=1 Tax=Catenovulum agarivorans TaxID=1172192 RepID=UPI000300F809|nr:hypothetical protein [Catenovulum agarivorans]
MAEVDNSQQVQSSSAELLRQLQAEEANQTQQTSEIEQTEAELATSPQVENTQVSTSEQLAADDNADEQAAEQELERVLEQVNSDPALAQQAQANQSAQEVVGL